MYAPIDVKFDDGNILQPDIIYIAEDKKADLIKDRIEGTPDHRNIIAIKRLL